MTRAHAKHSFCRRMAAFLLLLLIIPAYAQLPTGTILGVVKDSSGAVIPAASVTIRNTETDFVRTVTTGDDGAYRVPALPVGRYTLKFEKSGFKTENQQGLVLNVSEELVANSTLQVGASSQEVVVTSEAPLVNTTSSSLGGLVSEQKMGDLPLNGRNWVDLTLMQSGVEKHSNTGGNSPVAAAGTFYSANGATIRSNNYMLDGAPMLTIYGATQAAVSGNTLGVEGIREYKVETNTFSAEYGLTMGSQTTIVSKNGTNSFHGSAFEYLRNDKMDARNYFDPNPSQLNGHRLPEFRRNNFGGSIGGPIVKDRTFFFATYEEVSQRKGLSLVGNAIPANCRSATNNPCATFPSPVAPLNTVAPVIIPLLPLFPLPSQGKQFTDNYVSPVAEEYGQFRIDQTFSAKDTAFARYTIDNATLSQPNLGAPNPNLVDNLNSQSQFTTVSETHIFSSSLLNTARFSLSRTPLHDVSPSPTGPQYSMFPGLPLGAINIGGITSFSPGLQVTHNQKIYAWSDDMFYTRGRHSLKFGTLITRWNQEMELQAQLRGSANFADLAHFLSASPNQYTGNTSGSQIRRIYTSGTYGFYLQDDMRLSSRLTLNAGLRYEFASDYTEQNGRGAALRDIVSGAATTVGSPIKDPSKLNFSPRLGFAWDVFGNGRTALRGGFALLYDIGNLSAALIQGANGTLPFSSVSTNANPAPGSFTLPFTFSANALATSLNGPDYNYGQPKLLSYNLTLERQLPFGMGLTAGYAGSHGYDIPNRTEGNPTQPTILPSGQEFWPAGPCPAHQTTGCVPRVNPNWSNITLIGTFSESWYDSLQVALNKRVGHGLQFQLNYTWSKLIDMGNGQQPLDNSTVATDTLRPFNDRGPAAFDVTQNFRYNLLYYVPKSSHSGFVGGLMNGWWLSSIISAQTGYPFSPLLNSNRSRSGALGGGGGIDRPDVVSGSSMSSITHGTSAGCGNPALNTPTQVAIPPGTPVGTAARWYDPCAFAIPAIGFLGNSGRDSIRGPGLANVDFSVVKDTGLHWLGEAGKLELRAELFNIFNHANFAVPNATVYAAAKTGENPLATAGQIVSTVTPSRQVQLALKILF